MGRATILTLTLTLAIAHITTAAKCQSEAVYEELVVVCMAVFMVVCGYVRPLRRINKYLDEPSLTTAA